MGTDPAWTALAMNRCVKVDWTKKALEDEIISYELENCEIFNLEKEAILASKRARDTKAASTSANLPVILTLCRNSAWRVRLERLERDYVKYPRNHMVRWGRREGGSRRCEIGEAASALVFMRSGCKHGRCDKGGPFVSGAGWLRPWVGRCPSPREITCVLYGISQVAYRPCTGGLEGTTARFADQKAILSELDYKVQPFAEEAGRAGALQKRLDGNAKELVAAKRDLGRKEPALRELSRDKRILEMDSKAARAAPGRWRRFFLDFAERLCTSYTTLRCVQALISPDMLISVLGDVQARRAYLGGFQRSGRENGQLLHPGDDDSNEERRDRVHPPEGDGLVMEYWSLVVMCVVCPRFLLLPLFW